MSYFFKLLLLSLFTSVLTFSLKANNTSFKMSYFEDVASIETFNSIQNQKFVSVDDNIVSLGIRKSTVWVKLKIDKKVFSNRAVLKINRPFLDEAIIQYALKDHSIVSDTLGMKYVQSRNKFKHFYPVFEIPIKDLKTDYIYIRARSRWSMLIPVEITSKDEFNNTRTTEYLIAGLLIGGLLLMSIYNFFLYFSTRDKNYLLYVVASLGAILSQGYIYGILIPFLSPESPEFTFSFPVIIMAITGIFCCWFALRFLDIKNTSKTVYYLLVFSICFGLFNIILEFLSIGFDISNLYYISRKINIINVLLLSSIIFYSALYSLIKGKKIALYFTIAWTFYLSGMFVFALKTVGILPHNAFTSHFMHIGTFMEVMLLSFALGHKYSLVRVEKERLEQQTREDLEKLVKQQTAQLEISLDEKEILLKEIHHRVKNNLQIIISLLDLQVASVNDSANKEILTQSKSRVYSMSLIHQKLYQSDNLARINMKSYLDELFMYVQNSYFIPGQKINMEIEVDNQEMSITSAVPLGLIVNELLTNCYKYGMNLETDNGIKLSLAFSQHTIVLKVGDTGSGFKENKSEQGVKKSLGLFLVKSLTKQLRGEVKRFQEDQYFVTQLSIPTENFS